MKIEQTDQREKYLTRLAEALYESALHEDDPSRLELHRQVALKLANLLDQATNDDQILHPDLGLELLLFIELKHDSITDPDLAVGVASHQQVVIGILHEIKHR